MTSKFLRFGDDFLRFSKSLCRNWSARPLRHSHSIHLLEGNAECIVTTKATLVGQFLSAYRLTVCYCLLVKTDEVLDAQTVDVGIVSNALTGEILAQIEAVGSNNLSKLGKGNVVL